MVLAQRSFCAATGRLRSIEAIKAAAGAVRHAARIGKEQMDIVLGHGFIGMTGVPLQIFYPDPALRPKRHIEMSEGVLSVLRVRFAVFG